MSSMLEQAIVDAEALKEAAIKNAENELIEKYSEDIKEAVENLLEQAPPEEEEAAMDPMAAMFGAGGPAGAPPMGPEGAPPGMPPMGPEGEGPVPGEEVEDDLAPSWAEEGEELCPCPGDEDEVTLSLSGLAQLMGVGEEPEADELLASEEAAGEIMGEPTEEEQFLVQESMLSDILGEDMDLSDENIYEEIELEEDDNLDVYEEGAVDPDSPVVRAREKTQKAAEKMGGGKAHIGTDPISGHKSIYQRDAPSPRLGMQHHPGERQAGTLSSQEKIAGGGEATARPDPGFDVENLPDWLTKDIAARNLQENTQRHIAQLEERLRAYDYYYTTLYENHTKLNENHTKLNETYKSTINENENKKETISDKAKKRFESLKKENKNHRQLVLTLKEKLDEANLSNVKLLYTNRVLNSISLNERQKDKIVEAVSKAGTVEEAKTIFETLQSAVEGASSSKKASKSLNEAVANNSSAFLPRREVKNSDPSLVDRMQKLAGITKI